MTDKQQDRVDLTVVGGSDVVGASAALAHAVAAATQVQAQAAGVLESGTAAGARQFADAAGAVQEAARDEALLAALAGLDAAEAVVQALVLAPSAGGGEPLLTAEQARLVVAKSSEASARLTAAAKASGAFAVAAAACGLAHDAADAAAAFELHLLAAAVAARELVDGAGSGGGTAG